MIAELMIREKTHRDLAEKHSILATEFRKKAKDTKLDFLAEEYNRKADEEWQLFDIEMAIAREMQDILHCL